MRAIIIERFGDPKKLVIQTLPDPEQALCVCGHTRGEHRAGPLRRLVRSLLGWPNA